VDDGALVSAERTALFELATTGDLRVEVDVPQWSASQVKPGMVAKVVSGGQTVDAKVSRIAGALDPVLRTLHCELVPDPAAKILVPGAYVRVTFQVPRDEPVVQLPGAAIAVRGGVPMVGVVGAGELIQFIPVKMVRELGREVEVLGEVPLGGRVALYPPPSLVNGDVVQAIETETKKVASTP
jgi:multidrug efflux pump subunit AcrA (membrane-fusion protein)